MRSFSSEHAHLHELLTGGDRRSIADSNQARRLIEKDPSRVAVLAALTDDENWLVVLRALALFRWTPAQMRRVEAILLENVDFPQTFVRAWALDSLSILSERRTKLAPTVERYLREFARSPKKALQARARRIRARLDERR